MASKSPEIIIDVQQDLDDKCPKKCPFGIQTAVTLLVANTIGDAQSLGINAKDISSVDANIICSGFNKCGLLRMSRACSMSGAIRLLDLDGNTIFESSVLNEQELTDINNPPESI